VRSGIRPMVPPAGQAFLRPSITGRTETVLSANGLCKESFFGASDSPAPICSLLMTDAIFYTYPRVATDGPVCSKS
jgi:hypothetical protein